MTSETASVPLQEVLLPTRLSQGSEHAVCITKLFFVGVTLGYETFGAKKQFGNALKNIHSQKQFFLVSQITISVDKD